MIVKNIKPQCTNAFDTLFKRNMSTDSLEVPIEENVVIQCNKWRPYYYDTFNRAGNLTILSLSKRRNAIIENLHTYKNKSNTWHDRLKRKFPEEDFTDYAAVRVYWDYKRQESSEREHTPSNKTFFLFTEE